MNLSPNASRAGGQSESLEVGRLLDAIPECGCPCCALAADAYDEVLDELMRTEGDWLVAKREAGRARDALRKIRRHVNSSQVSPEIGALIRQTVHDGLGES